MKTGWWESLFPLSLVLIPSVTNQEEITKKEWVVQTRLSMKVSVARIIFSPKDLKSFFLPARLDEFWEVVTQKQLNFFNESTLVIFAAGVVLLSTNIHANNFFGKRLFQNKY